MHLGLCAHHAVPARALVLGALVPVALLVEGEAATAHRARAAVVCILCGLVAEVAQISDPNVASGAVRDAPHMCVWAPSVVHRHGNCRFSPL